ncbi:hypothetical protein BOTBODRAFT_175174 [Botryobasidium botryosum FD-172 SS1]|uniref:Uncharacterized protein n=1 Tax=Botryobasidium botryosum (strain FD-172 SS1) TaxID=930990 RepID=A0A067MH67_BOTB1|nr:hypothetical protein BOTBODRAFT_175174 [Botryobasidium botryosum FD-172 SS1]
MSSLRGRGAAKCSRGCQHCSAARSHLPPLPPIPTEHFQYPTLSIGSRSQSHIRSYSASTSSSSPCPSYAHSKRQSHDSSNTSSSSTNRSAVSLASSASVYSTETASTSMSSYPPLPKVYPPVAPLNIRRPRTATSSMSGEYDSMLRPRPAPAPPSIACSLPTMPPAPPMLYRDESEALRAGSSKMGEESFQYQEKLRSNSSRHRLLSYPQKLKSLAKSLNESCPSMKNKKKREGSIEFVSGWLEDWR